jgi:hypothetical protein
MTFRRMDTLGPSTRDFGRHFAKLMSDDGVRIFIVAFLLRLILVVAWPDLIPEPEDKLERYDVIALSLARGEGSSLGDQLPP